MTATCTLCKGWGIVRNGDVSDDLIVKIGPCPRCAVKGIGTGVEPEPGGGDR